MTSQFKRIELLKQPLDTLAHMIALCTQCADFLFQLIDNRPLSSELRLSLGGALFGGNASLPLTLDQLNRTPDALFQRGEIIGTESKSLRLGRLLIGVLCRLLCPRRRFFHF